MNRRYRLHGLCVESALELDASLDLDPPQDRPDLHVERVHEPPPEVDGAVACEIEIPAGTYVGRVGDAGWSLRLDGRYIFAMRSGSDRLLAWSAAGDESVLAALVGGNVLAFWLQLQGRAMFHASAVVHPAATIAIAGPQGIGKSTLAAHLCAGGGRLLTDDVLRIDTEAGGCVCHPGGRTLRLRQDVEPLEALIPHEATYRTWDGRLAVRPPAAAGPHRLDAFVLPRHAAPGDGLGFERLSTKQAMIELLGLPRWFGWHIDAPQRLHFRTAADIAATVPVFRLRLPLEATRPDSELCDRVLEAIA